MTVSIPRASASLRADAKILLAKREAEAVQELVMIGFTDKRRALEVLPQLQRLEFDWGSDLQHAIAVEVESDGRLRLHHSELLDPASGPDDVAQWKAILNAITPLPHVPPGRSEHTALEFRSINAEASNWIRGIAFDNRDFIRNAAAILRPGNSAILTLVRDFRPALQVLSGYSPIVLHTSFARPSRATGSAL
jgi:uncharacterized membrane protein